MSIRTGKQIGRFVKPKYVSGSLYMNHEFQEPESMPEHHGSCPLTFTEVSCYLRRYRLGNYNDEIYADLRSSFELAREKDIKNARAYAFGILRNLVCDKLEQRGRIRDLENVLRNELSRSQCQPCETSSQHGMAEKVKTVISTLDPKYRVPVNLRIKYEMTFPQIADIWGTSVSTARIRYHEGVRQIRNSLNGEGNDR